MKLLIDNLDGRGAMDCTGFVGAREGARLVRKLNCAAELKVQLLAGTPDFVSPACGARVTLVRDDGSNLFAGYVASLPVHQYAGRAEQGPQYVWQIRALSDAMLLDQKALSPCPPLVDRSAGSAFRQLTENTLPGRFDLSSVEAGDPIPHFSADASKPWSVAAAELALLARCGCRDEDGALLFAPLGEKSYSLSEGDTAFTPDALQLQSVNRIVNDLTVMGETEPGAHVKDYFVGDGYTTTFYLSQIPFTRSSQTAQYSRTILDEEYAELDPTRWRVTDPQNVLSVSGGQLQVAGGAGADGQTRLDFVERVELGGATVLQHGDVVFNAASDGVIGGMYNGAVSIAGCIAGFRITPSGANSNIQALVNGALAGTPLATKPGHHYLFATQLYPTEIYRMQQAYHSSLHPSGNARGGEEVSCDVRVVLEVHDIDPANPASQVAPAIVLYDDVITNAPGFCTYCLINAASMQCAVAFTYIFLATDALVRSALPEQAPRTRRAGSLREGAECRVSRSETLQFYPEYIPAANETIEVTYRGTGRSMARVVNSASIAEHQHGADDGVRSRVLHVAAPKARTSADCEVAALALLDDAGQGWTGEYQTWSQFLPGAAADIFPGDGLNVDVPSRAATFSGIVREVEISEFDWLGESPRYTLRFVDAGDPSLAFAFGTPEVRLTRALQAIDVSQVDDIYLSDLTGAEITTVTSTTVSVDAGADIPAGGGIEVRYADAGWSKTNSRNLIGRFTSRSFALPRYARGQTYFLRSYDGSSPSKYSRNSTVLHVDYPL